MSHRFCKIYVAFPKKMPFEVFPGGFCAMMFHIVSYIFPGFPLFGIFCWDDYSQYGKIKMFKTTNQFGACQNSPGRFTTGPGRGGFLP